MGRATLPPSDRGPKTGAVIRWDPLNSAVTAGPIHETKGNLQGPIQGTRGHIGWIKQKAPPRYCGATNLADRGCSLPDAAPSSSNRAAPQLASPCGFCIAEKAASSSRRQPPRHVPKFESSSQVPASRPLGLAWGGFPVPASWELVGTRGGPDGPTWKIPHPCTSQPDLLLAASMIPRHRPS